MLFSNNILVCKEWNDNLTLKEGLALAAKILIQTTDAAVPSANQTEIAILELVDGMPRHRFLEESEVSTLLKEAGSSQAIIVEDK